LTEEQWQEIEKTLPQGADRAHFRKQLERIAHNNATPAQRVAQCDRQIAVCQRFLQAVPKLDMFEDKAAIIAQLERQIQLDRQTRDTCQRLLSERSGIFLREYEILILWVSRGYELPISSSGDHVDFFAAAYAAIFGKPPPDPESIRNIIKRFRRLQRVMLAGAGNLSAAAEIIPGPRP
jgi:hypothetical protein